MVSRHRLIRGAAQVESAYRCNPIIGFDGIQGRRDCNASQYWILGAGLLQR